MLEGEREPKRHKAEPDGDGPEDAHADDEVIEYTREEIKQFMDDGPEEIKHAALTKGKASDKKFVLRGIMRGKPVLVKKFFTGKPDIFTAYMVRSIHWFFLTFTECFIRLTLSSNQNYIWHKNEKLLLEDKRLAASGSVPKLLGFSSTGEDHRATRRHYLIMEDLPNSCEEATRDAKWGKLLKILNDTVHALNIIHKEQHAHLNVRPTSIMFDTYGNAKLYNFGAVKGGRIIGTTPGYQAPNLQTEWKQVYKRSAAVKMEKLQKIDIYALGVTMLQLIMKVDDDRVKMESTDEGKKFLTLINRKRLQNQHLVAPEYRNTGCNHDDAVHITNFAMQCINDNSDARPTIDEVVRTLGNLKVTET
ncbi:hypothetical protein Tsubulata_025011 [Turnera subulata]|uniref:Protein kinase domain-containing protein n=1 Tax=Turnera subulata TaxID=218843 RepID=A0A9Q0FNH0_9ROSI|nr:hypothetical protein Tsubulata_025011 [Turnera subulata]